MPPVVFIGLGLNDERGMTLEGLDAARASNRVFAELYTNIMPNLKLARLERILRKKIEILTRSDLEENGGERILSSAQDERVAFLVPGDPMIATTHVSLLLSLARRGIGAKIIHGASIFSAICGATGLQSYKFGKSITFPHQAETVPSSVLETIRENKVQGLHTLLLLDVETGNHEQLNIPAVLSRMVGKDASIDDWLGVGAARIGSSNESVKAGKVKTLKHFDFGPSPHCIVFPGKLHFMEEEAIRVLDGASPSDLETVR